MASQRRNMVFLGVCSLDRQHLTYLVESKLKTALDQLVGQRRFGSPDCMIIACVRWSAQVVREIANEAERLGFHLSWLIGEQRYYWSHEVAYSSLWSCPGALRELWFHPTYVNVSDGWDMSKNGDDV